MKVLETERLILRPWTLEDADAFYEFASDPEVGPKAGWPPLSSAEEARDKIRDYLRLGSNWAVALRESGEIVGGTGFFNDPHRGPELESKMIFYHFSPKHWGHGYAPEAVRKLLYHLFEEIGVEMVSVGHFDFNKNSRRVIEKCGFTYETTLRGAYHRKFDGAEFSELCYSMTREEYQERYCAHH